LVAAAALEDFGSEGTGSASAGFGCHSGTVPQIIFIGTHETPTDVSWKIP
jgi:hypothetical protein